MAAENVEILTTAPVAEPAGHTCGCGGHDEADPVLDVRGCTFAAPDMDSMFFSIPDGPRVGVLPVADTRFEDCTFEHVGWAGDQRLRAVLGGSPEA